MAMVIKNARRKPRKQRNKQTDGVGQYASDAWSLAKRTAVGLNEIRKLINIETKFFDFYTNTTFSTTSITNISLMAQGLTSTTRVGDSIRLQHIEGSFQLVANSNSAGARCRITVIRDLDNAGTAPTSLLVYQNDTTQPACMVTSMKFNELERFSVLFDEVLVVCNGTFSATSHFSMAHNGHVKFLGAGATAADAGKGSVFLLITTSEAANLPTVTAYTRIMYTDD
jgi:hypothetical protein